MAKKTSSRVEKPKSAGSLKAVPFVADSKIVDPALASLFASSLGPVEPPPKSRYQSSAPKSSKLTNEEADNEEDDGDLSSIQSESGDDDEGMEVIEDNASFMADRSSGDKETGATNLQSDEELQSGTVQLLVNGTQSRPQKKRKRGGNEEELEDVYMRKLAREEAKEEAKVQSDNSRKRLKSINGEDSIAHKHESDSANGEDDPETQSEASDVESLDEETHSIPKHETLTPSKDVEELEKASRTVFLGNVSSEAITSRSAKRALLHHLASFITSLPAHTPSHKVESLRFRSTAFASAMPKKAAFAKKEIMDATTKSTNAYAVYSTQVAAREAAKRLNGTIVLDRHLRVDEIAHPAKVDHRRCVFVGNLGFVDDETAIQAAEEREGQKKSKKKEPGDVEEGLWVHFSKAGTVESVRVVRDSKTRVGKGIAYVQFTNENGVEAALQFNDKKFPPLLPRKLRVVRAKGMKQNAKQNPSSSTRPNSKSVYNPKVSAHEKSMQGRANKLLGRAGAAQARHGQKSLSGLGRPGSTPLRAPEAFVFEGHRASSKQGTSGLKLGGSGRKKGGKPKTRSSKRGAAWKASGKSKPGK